MPTLPASHAARNRARAPLRQEPGETYGSENARTFAEVRAAAENCRRCALWRDAAQTVFGEGPESAKVVFVGEQPGDR